MLTEDLLDELAARWRTHGAPLLPHLADGLSERELRDRLEPLGLQLPAEARRWWCRHDGPPADAPRSARVVGPPLVYLSVGEALEYYRAWTSYARRAAADTSLGDTTPEYWWSPSWFPILARTDGVIVCDCGVVADSPTPIREITGWSLDFREPKASSFGEMVTWWIKGFDAGAYTYDAEGGRWIYRPEVLPSDLQTSPLT